ncbi:Neutrophil cytosol factor 4 [Trichoplax sp. H2]|nr:Neutrophil cytosol factor 4 [Trichoplax sp. H2]|eukprot:RDD47228.1 Neutrophil cytosol factor 4 [Trichoplax sp. H2]
MSQSELAIDATILDCHKVQLENTKYYVYSIKVILHSGETHVIYRRFRQFNGLLLHLERRFPLEAGKVNPQDRILPTVPGKIIFGRSAKREVAERRLPLLDRYVRELLSLHRKISQCDLIQSFLRQNKEDYDLHKQFSHSLAEHFVLRNQAGSSPKLARRKPEATTAASRRRVSEPTIGVHTESLLKLISTNAKRDSDSEEEIDYSYEDFVRVINYHYNGCVNEIEINSEFFYKPKFEDLFFLISQRISKFEITLNYIDYEGDLIAIMSDEELDIMIEELAQGNGEKSYEIPWQIYVTDLGDFSSYNTDIIS